MAAFVSLQELQGSTYIANLSHVQTIFQIFKKIIRVESPKV